MSDLYNRYQEKMRLAIICGGRDAVNVTDTPLQFIEYSLKKIEEVFSANSWICKKLELIPTVIQV